VGGVRIPDADELPTGSFAAEYGEARLGEIQAVGQEAAAGGVGRPSDGRCGEAQDDPVGQFHNQLISRSAGLDVDGQQDVGTVLLEEWRVGSHLGGTGFSGMAASKRSWWVLR
jgi:hypothetical protein